MGIEGGPGGYEKPRPRSVEASIEGEMVSSFTEIFDIDDADHIPLWDIQWTTASLRFKKVGNYTKQARYGSDPIDIYSAEFDYIDQQGQKQTANLSLLTSEEKPVLFAGTMNGFYAHDPLMNGRKDPFYVVGLEPYELEERMSELSAIWHELGHVGIFHINADTKLANAANALKMIELPKVAKAITYRDHLAEALLYSLQRTGTEFDRQQLTQLMNKNNRVDESVRLFHERNAWAGGMYLAQANEFPTGFHDPASYFTYARLCLSSYAQHYKDEKFVEGWKKTRVHKEQST